jgi:hypothetical protein
MMADSPSNSGGDGVRCNPVTNPHCGSCRRHPPARTMNKLLSAFVCMLSQALATAGEAADSGWIPLFNGRDLDGWVVKVAGHPLGVNYADTFYVEEGILKVGYDLYPVFAQQFAHLYTVNAYSHYILRLEYRFEGHVMADAPSWTALNSGVMIHAQSPLSMTLGQLWPASLECQFLATGTTAGTQTGNVCTPGTHIRVDGTLTEAHIIDSTARLYPAHEWVDVEVEVHGSEHVIHRINGVEVLRYTHPQLDPRDGDAQRLLAAGLPLALGHGHIALQAEGQPVWFRNVRFRPMAQ